MSETEKPQPPSAGEPQVPPTQQPASPPGPPQRPNAPVIHRPDLLVDLERGLKPVNIKDAAPKKPQRPTDEK